MQEINLYISPCPNDTFAFYALLNGIIKCEHINITPHFLDIDELNNVALGNVNSNNNTVCKISCATLPYIESSYTLLNAGAAMGFGNAPLLVSSTNKLAPHPSIALPGKYTTAAALLKKFFPDLNNTYIHPFNEIIPLIENGTVEAGVIIHEGRFVYQKHNLHLIADLGALWEQMHPNIPIPLGCIVANNQIETHIIEQIDEAISQSVRYAIDNPLEPMQFVKKHAQELDPEVLEKHISYFVNHLTIDMGRTGHEAINLLNNAASDSTLA